VVGGGGGGGGDGDNDGLAASFVRRQRQSRREQALGLADTRRRRRQETVDRLLFQRMVNARVVCVHRRKFHPSSPLVDVPLLVHCLSHRDPIVQMKEREKAGSSLL
jgi:hypothetical protein